MSDTWPAAHAPRSMLTCNSHTPAHGGANGNHHAPALPAAIRSISVWLNSTTFVGWGGCWGSRHTAWLAGTIGASTATLCLQCCCRLRAVAGSCSRHCQPFWTCSAGRWRQQAGGRYCLRAGGLCDGLRCWLRGGGRRRAGVQDRGLGVCGISNLQSWRRGRGRYGQGRARRAGGRSQY
jgi:hypothetical protein